MDVQGLQTPMWPTSFLYSKYTESTMQERDKIHIDFTCLEFIYIKKKHARHFKNQTFRYLHGDTS